LQWHELHFLEFSLQSQVIACNLILSTHLFCLIGFKFPNQALSVPKRTIAAGKKMNGN